MSDYPDRGVQTGIITELIAELQRESDVNDPDWIAGQTLLQRTIQVLTVLAQEIERLIELNLNSFNLGYAESVGRAEAAEARAQELEHRLKTVHHTMELLQASVQELQSELAFRRAGHPPSNTTCDHKHWTFEKHGRVCTCGTFMVDFGD